MVLDQSRTAPVAWDPHPRSVAQSLAKSGGYVTSAAVSGSAQRRLGRDGRPAPRPVPDASSKEDFMKTPLDTISGTIISGFVLTAILYYVVRALVG